MKFSCKYCGRIHDKDFDCGCKPKKIDRYKRREEEKGRYTYAFRIKSAQVKADSHHLCAVCLAQGKLTYDELETHHIVKLTEAPELLTEDSNLVVLCKLHHRMADDGRLDPEMLKSLAKARECPPGGDPFRLLNASTDGPTKENK